MFDDVRLWTEGETYNDRVVLLNCYGLNPRCSTLDNIKKIGEKWGPVIYVEEDEGEIKSLTHARLLVRTKAQNRIDAHIRVLFDKGCCEVWVKESNLCPCKFKQYLEDIRDKNRSPMKLHAVSESLRALPDKNPTPIDRVNAAVTPLSKLGYMVNDCVNNRVPEFVNETPLSASVEHCQNLEGCFEDCVENEQLCMERNIGQAVGTVDTKHIQVNNEMENMHFWEDPTIPAILNAQPVCTNFCEAVDRFDLISSIECTQLHTSNKFVGRSDGEDNLVVYGSVGACSKRRARGRPKKVASSLPVPMVVPSTPSKSLLEAHGGTSKSALPSNKSLVEAQKTWDNAKLIGVSSGNERDVIQELRKSKRLMLLEADAS